ncbi:MAG: hypothetical protein II375_05910 [Bacteroidales bacterium]|nr:hypothetical protein [Bacteroidales bacterium]
MNKTFFRPFVGASYQNGGIFGKRIMILGDSHYCGEACRDCGMAAAHPECTRFTPMVVNKYLDYIGGKGTHEKWMNTFLKFERSLAGHETNLAESRQIWQSLLFFNYLQVAMDEPRQAGTEEQYQTAQESFYETIDAYKPQYIIAWGMRLWESLPGDNRWQQGAPIVSGGRAVETGSYALGSGRRAQIMAAYHPSSSRYAWEDWHEVINQFLSR